VAAQGGDFAHGLRLGRDPVPPEYGFEHRARLGHVERGQPVYPAATRSGQADQAPVAGDDHCAATVRREERCDLLRARRVIQEEEHPPVRHRGLQPGGGVGAAVAVWVRDPANLPGQFGRDQLRRLGITVAGPEPDGPLAVGEADSHQVRDVNRERRLADSRRS
jgi:hypothetical protein